MVDAAAALGGPGAALPQWPASAQLGSSQPGVGRLDELRLWLLDFKLAPDGRGGRLGAIGAPPADPTRGWSLDFVRSYSSFSQVGAGRYATQHASAAARTRTPTPDRAGGGNLRRAVRQGRDPSSSLQRSGTALAAVPQWFQVGSKLQILPPGWRDPEAWARRPTPFLRAPSSVSRIVYPI